MKVDPHIHTSFSDGFNTPQEVMDYVVNRTDLKIISITDHNTMDGIKAALEYKQANPEKFKNLEIIPGEEISTREGHILALFIKEEIPPHHSATFTIDAIHRQGGIAVAPHPFTIAMRSKGLESVGNLIYNLQFDAIEVANANPIEIISNIIARWKNFFHLKLPQIGGSDAHFIYAIGKCYTSFKGETVEDFRKALLRGETKAHGIMWGAISFLRFLQEQKRRKKKLTKSFSLMLASRNDLIVEPAEIPGINLVILRCSGNLGGWNAKVLLQKLKPFMKEKKINLIINLDQVPYIDEKGLNALKEIFEYIKNYKGDFILCSLQPQVRAFLGSLDELFLIYSEEKEAINFFQIQEGG